ncbi:MAG TPA: hypothetical protein VGD11_07030 [Mycobacteriales bacterium]
MGTPIEHEVQTTTSAWIPALLSVGGSVCGALVPAAFSASPHWNLVGLALGATIPALVGIAAFHWAIRLVVLVAITVGALLATYTGLLVRDAVAGESGTTVPTPTKIVPVAAAPDPSPTPDPSVDPSSALRTCEGDLCIEVTPARLTCTPDGCASPVTIRSTGARVLLTTGVEFTGDAADAFTQDGTCADHVFDPGTECTFAVSFDPGRATGSAALVINQNLAGPATVVPLVGEGPSASGVDLTLAPGGTDCSVRSGEVHVGVQVRAEGDDPGEVSVAAATGTGVERDLKAPAGERREIVFPVVAETTAITLTVDPDNEIAERREDNNTVQLVATVPAGGTEDAATCAVQP